MVCVSMDEMHSTGRLVLAASSLHLPCAIAARPIYIIRWAAFAISPHARPVRRPILRRPPCPHIWGVTSRGSRPTCDDDDNPYGTRARAGTAAGRGGVRRAGGWRGTSPPLPVDFGIVSSRMYVYTWCRVYTRWTGWCGHACRCMRHSSGRIARLLGPPAASSPPYLKIGWACRRWRRVAGRVPTSVYR